MQQEAPDVSQEYLNIKFVQSKVDDARRQLFLSLEEGSDIPKIQDEFNIYIRLLKQFRLIEDAYVIHALSKTNTK